MSDHQLERQIEVLDTTVATWTETHKALSRRVSLAEDRDDRQDDALTNLVGRVADLEERAIFAQRLSRETATIIIRVPIDQVKATVLTVVQSSSSLLAIEVLR